PLTFSMERGTGIEPASPAWKAGALPLSYPRTVEGLWGSSSSFPSPPCGGRGVRSRWNRPSPGFSFPELVPDSELTPHLASSPQGRGKSGLRLLPEPLNQLGGRGRI